MQHKTANSANVIDTGYTDRDLCKTLAVQVTISLAFTINHSSFLILLYILEVRILRIYDLKFIHIINATASLSLVSVSETVTDFAAVCNCSDL